MPVRRKLDGYGRPLPSLVEAEQQPVRLTRLNDQQQQLILQLLQAEYDALLVQGTYAEVTLTFAVRDGAIAQDVYLTRCHQHRLSED